MTETMTKPEGIDMQELKGNMLAGMSGVSNLDSEDLTAAFDACVEWAEEHNIEKSAGNAYTLVCRALLMVALDDEAFNRTIDEDSEEAVERLMTETGNSILARFGISREEADDVTLVKDKSDNDEPTAE